jgi:hypothetical protein
MKGHMMTQPRRVLRTIGKFLAYGAALVVVVLAIAHFAWKYSGSNEWELWRDKKGVAVYTLKAPGATRLQFKVVTRIKARLDSIVAAMTDTSTDGCKSMMPGCTSGRIFKTFDSRDFQYIQAYRIDRPRPQDADLPRSADQSAPGRRFVRTGTNRVQ